MTKHARRKTLADPAAARPRCLARAKQRSLARAAFTVGRSVRAPSRKSLQETPRPRPRSRAAGKASPRGCGSRTSTTLRKRSARAASIPMSRRGQFGANSLRRRPAAINMSGALHGPDQSGRNRPGRDQRVNESDDSAISLGRPDALHRRRPHRTRQQHGRTIDPTVRRFRRRCRALGHHRFTDRDLKTQ
jgi:hypothetical protein